MLEYIKEWFKNLIFSRCFVMVVAFVVLFAILVERLFVMQIINGEDYLNNFTLTIKKETTLKSARGNIYDRNGELLAYNELSYSVTIEDNYESGSKKNSLLNETIRKTVSIIEDHGDKVINSFNISINSQGEYEYNVSDMKLNRFLADIYGHAKIDDMSDEERNSTPEELIDYMCSTDKYGIGEKITDEAGNTKFIPGQGFTRDEILKIITIRYAMSSNAYQKYLSTVIAFDVSDETVAAIMENKDVLQGVNIEEETLRKYNSATYFAHILGYTGYASTDDLIELKDSAHDYNMNDMVGKAGVEKAMEEYLQGTKGKDEIYVDNVGKITGRISHEEPIAGDDVYLSIDADLQRAIYNLLEQKLAGILVSKIINMKEYNNSVVKSSSMMIPIDDVYFSLINNNIIDISHFSDSDAQEYEHQVYSSFLLKQASVAERLKNELLDSPTPYNELEQEMQVYESYIVSRLMSQNKGIIVSSLVDKDDETYKAWAIDEKISLKEYLTYAISKNWVDITKFDLNKQYSDTSEVYTQLVDYIIDDIRQDSGFSKKMYRYMIRDNELSGREVCMLLFEQRVIYGTTEEKSLVETGAKTPYDFIINKIANIEITPGQLALDPCSGSCVVTGVNGELLACVTYPGYDSNKLANSIDADYYAKLMTDLASPMYNNATQQMTAPGSTFKMISAIAGLSEGIINPGEIIYCNGVYDYLDTQKTCWAYPGAHGQMDVMNAIGNSCNCFFYEVGFRMATDGGRKVYDEQAGLTRFKKYADMFGLTEKTGVEMEENEPKFSTVLPVDTAIGQGSHNYTTIGLARYVTAIANKGNCYNLSLVDRVEKSDHELVKTFGPTLRNRIDLPDSTWNQVRSGMRLVVEKAAAFRDFPIKVAGKTGTAQTSKSRTNHALFVGFAPYEAPEITIAIRIAYGYTSGNAAQLASDVIKYYFDLEEKSELINGIADTSESENIED